MSQTIQYNVKVNTGDSVKTLGQLESELASINEALKLVKPGSEAFDELAKSAQNATKQIEQINNQVAGITAEDKIRALDGGIKILGGSVQGLVGGLGLLGVESEKLGAFEEKAASAIAFGIGLKDVSEGLGQVTEAFKKSGIAAKLFGNITKKALISTGIGAFVVALGVVVAYWDDIVAYFDDANGKLETQNGLLREQIEDNKFNLSILDLKRQAAKLRGDSEEDIVAEIKKQLLLEQESYKQLIANLEIQLEREKAAAREVTLWEKIKIGAASAFGGPVGGAIQSIKAINENTEETAELQEKLNEAKLNAEQIDVKLAQLDNENTKKKLDNLKKVEDKEKELQSLKDEILKAESNTLEEQRQLELDNTTKYYDELIEKAKKEKIDTTELEKSKLEVLQSLKDKFAEEDLAGEQKLNDLRKEIRDANTIGEEEERKLKLEKLDEYYADLIQKAKDNNLETSELEKSQLEARQALLNEFDEVDKERRNKAAEDEKKLQQEKLDLQKESLQTLSELFGQETALGKAALLAKQAIIVQELIANAKGLTFKAQVAVQEATLDGAKAGSAIAAGSAETAKVGFPQNIPLLIGYAAQAAGIISAVKSAVSKTKAVAGSGGGLPSFSLPNPGASVPSTPTTQTPTEQQLGVVNATQGKQQPIQAYVIAGNVTSAQEAESKIRQRRVVGRN